MPKKTVIGLAIFAVFILGYWLAFASDFGFYSNPADFCEQDSDCTPINCVRAPCPYNECQKDMCVTVFPRETVCKGDAECFFGEVTKVVDGDTIDVDGRRVRLAIVDTPETDEEGFEEARKFVLDTCPIGSEALVDEDDDQIFGSRGRVVAEVHCGSVNLNEALLEGGHAVIDFVICDKSEFSGESWAEKFGC